MTRYALYFAPAPGSPWWQAGCRWFGRDPVGGAQYAPFAISGIPPLALEKLTSQARRYGFHATLKAPFRLAQGFTETHLLTMAKAFANVQQPIVLEDLRLRPLSGFLALQPAGPLNDISALAMRCVSYFDLLRSTPAPADLDRHRNAGLSSRQESLLQRWGYPCTEEEFRFHMTLTDSLAEVDAGTAYALRKAAEDCFAQALQSGAPAIDALTIFREDVPGAPFSAWQRLPFPAGLQEATLPTCGRLFFVVGPSGAGKDTLLQWVERHAGPNANLLFAQRTITRPAHSSEPHESIEESSFWQLAATGHFSMIWQANGLCYGIRRGIEAELKAGRDVIVNGSREYIPRLRQRFPDARIIWIEADTVQIRQRIETRQRENGAALLLRLERVTRFAPPEGAQVVRLDNSGPVERVMN